MNKQIIDKRREYELLLEVREREYAWLSLGVFKQREAELVHELNRLKFEAGICGYEEMPKAAYPVSHPSRANSEAKKVVKLKSETKRRGTYRRNFGGM